VKFEISRTFCEAQAQRVQFFWEFSRSFFDLLCFDLRMIEETDFETEKNAPPAGALFDF
jgi:hypothetical protein